jgi:anti-anti-sigma factor
MKIQPHAKNEDVTVVVADSDMNEVTAGSVVAELEQKIEGGAKKLVVDCRKLENISSFGMGILLRLQQKVARQGGEMKLAGTQPAVARMLKLVRIDMLFSSYPDVKSAAEAFAAKTL